MKLFPCLCLSLNVVLVTALTSLALSGCAAEPATNNADETELLDGDAEDFAPDQIIGANSVGRRLTVEGHVFVPVNAPTSEVTIAVRRQMRALFGAARTANIGLGERQPLINTGSYRRETVSVIDPARPTVAARSMQRVRYTYRTRAVLPRSLEASSTVASVTLFGNYTPYAQEIISACQSDRTQDLSAANIWYHFDPSLPSCEQAIAAETARLDSDRRGLANPARQVTTSEVSRRFLPLLLRVAPLEGNAAAYPEYHRLYQDNRFVAYSFFGLDVANDPWDYGARNYFRFLRTMMTLQPNLRVTAVSTGPDLLAVSWNGVAVTGVTYERVIGWVLDGRDYPSQVLAADVDAFRLQILRQWRDRYVTLGMTLNLSVGGVARPVPVEIRTYYGDEENAAAASAVRRYASAFAQADVFQYTGHSHLGSGPLDPGNYRASNFATGYQIMMVNSCVSFNYYNQFFGMHPGGTANLDTITNGIEVYLEGAGLSSARFMNAMIDGRFRGYLDILTDMRVDLPWEAAHDPARVVDGELDNAFSPARHDLSVIP